MISWAGAPTNLIAAGRYDSLIRAAALQLKSLHGPVMLRWFSEMGLPRKPAIRRLASELRRGVAAHARDLCQRGRHQRPLGLVPKRSAFRTGIRTGLLSRQSVRGLDRCRRLQLGT